MHHEFNGHELGQTPGAGEGQGSLSSCSPWSLEELGTTWRLNNSGITCFVSCQSLSHVRLFVTPRTIACQVLCPWNSPGKGTGAGCMPFSRDPPDTRVKPRSPALQADCLPSEPSGKPHHMLRCYSLPDYEIPAPDFLMATEVGSVDFRDNFFFF